jgi:AcrR family transcriptional regulator
VALGRPRGFDTDAALDRALELFWRQGYEGTSLTDLTNAMGITRPSLYAAFGNKEQLFRRALDRYTAERGTSLCVALNESRARDALARLLIGTAEFLADGSNPRGCLTIQGALSCGPDANPIKGELEARREATERAILDRLQRARREGDLPGDLDPVALSHYFAAVLQGMSVKAAGGADRAELQAVAETAMRVWPQ